MTKPNANHRELITVLATSTLAVGALAVSGNTAAYIEVVTDPLAAKLGDRMKALYRS